MLSHVKSIFSTRFLVPVRLGRFTDETTILNFRRMLEKHRLMGEILQAINRS